MDKNTNLRVCENCKFIERENLMCKLHIKKIGLLQGCSSFVFREEKSNDQ